MEEEDSNGEIIYRGGKGGVRMRSHRLIVSVSSGVM